MARLIGSVLDSGNISEDFLCQKLIDSFDDNYILYRNREIFGREFDVMMLMPNIGLLVFEVKGWLESSVLRIENGDTIIIGTAEGEVKSSPQKQVRGYRFAIERRIRQKTGKFPLVFTMVCYPKISRSAYETLHLNVVTEEEFTLLKDDLESKISLYDKINRALANVNAWDRTDFGADLQFEVRSLFEADLKADTRVELSAPPAPVPKASCYSLFSYIRADDVEATNRITQLAAEYACGCRVFVVTESRDHFEEMAKAIDEALNNKGLIRNKDNLLIDYNGKQGHLPPLPVDGNSFSAFNCALSIIEGSEATASIQSFCVVNGDMGNKREYMELIASHSLFNLGQYQVEHADSNRNVIIRAGAGTGKTYTMISRIGFLCYSHNMPIQSIAERVIMITFTNDAADQMAERLKAYFLNAYYITSNTDYIALISRIESMKISTIHSYVRSLIAALGTEFGYGVDLGIVTTQYYRQKIISQVLDDYITDKRKKHGDAYLKKLGLPIFELRNAVVAFIGRLHNKNIDILSVKPEDFGTLSETEGTELHELLACTIPEVERQYEKELLEGNNIHRDSMIALLNSYLNDPSSKSRIRELQGDKPQFMFVDEFQDTDDTQIEMLLSIARELDYKMFVVGDIKQCIYRFRGAKEKAFDQLDIKAHPQDWCEFALQLNYRTDTRLLQLFDCSFAAWGCRGDDFFAYTPATDRLIGSKRYNVGLLVNKFYKQITIAQESARLPALFEEIKRLQRRIKYDDERGIQLSAKEKCIAILVRENWQAEKIRKEGQRVELTIQTNTGGDLYRSAPAVDMLVLVNALLHFDEADYLYSLAASNFFSLEIPRSKLTQQRDEMRKGSWRSRDDEKMQTNYLIDAINALLSQSRTDYCKSWELIIRNLRIQPVLQVLRKLYMTLKPWQNYARDAWKQQEYRLNVDLLFEQLLASCNTDRLTINTLAEHLQLCVVSSVNVDSRTPPPSEEGVSIQCITVHKAKGLEYGHVILPYASTPIDRLKEDKLYVSTLREEHGHQIGYNIAFDEGRTLRNNFYDPMVEISEMSREETRILYVAMTRAIRSFSWIELAGRSNLSWQLLIEQEGGSDAL